MDLKEFEQALTIDKHDLDTELLSQADLFYRVAQEYAEAVSYRDQAHENLKGTDADLNLQIRQQFADSKITEAKINAMVLDHQEHKEKFHSWLKDKEKADKIGHLKEAFIQRSYMLRDLVQLYIAGYFNEKSVSVDDSASQEAVYKKRKERMHKKRLGKT